MGVGSCQAFFFLAVGAWLVASHATPNSLATYEDAFRQAGLKQQNEGRTLLAASPSPCTLALQCITSKLNGGGIPSFPTQLPDLLLPGGVRLLELLDLKTLVGYLVMKMQTSSLGGLLSQLGCPTTPLPFFNASTIAAPSFLGDLSDGACGNVAPLAGPLYIVGAASTKVPDWTKALPPVWQQKLGEYGKNFSICVAADPCTLAVNIGLTGLTADATLKIGDQALKLSAVNFRSLSYSDTGSVGIKKSDVGLWKNDMGAGLRPVGVPILGNVAFKFQGGITWAHKVDDLLIANITFTGQVQAVVKFNDPTRFALQLQSYPVLELYEGAFKIDFKQMAAIFTTKMLFFVEHRSDSDFNVYAGVRLKVKRSDMLKGLDALVSSLLKEYVHIPTDDNATSIEQPKDIDINVHINQNGGGVRVFLSGKVTLGSAFQQIMACPSCTVPLQSLVGLGIKFQFVPIQGKLKVFGSVTINRKEYFYTPGCSSNADCLSDQQCYSAGTPSSYCSI